MDSVTLAAIEGAFANAFSKDTCSEDDLPFWNPANRSRGHCAVAALTMHDLLGGDLLVAEVERDDQKVGVHYWNRLAGIDVDLTREQFLDNERVLSPRVVARPAGRPTHYAEQYDLFRDRVSVGLGIEITSREEDAP